MKKTARATIKINQKKKPLSEEITKTFKEPWWYVWGLRVLLVSLVGLIAVSITFGAICAIHGGWEWGP